MQSRFPDIFGGARQSGLGYRNSSQGFTEYRAIKSIGIPE